MAWLFCTLTVVYLAAYAQKSPNAVAAVVAVLVIAAVAAIVAVAAVVEVGDDSDLSATRSSSLMDFPNELPGGASFSTIYK